MRAVFFRLLVLMAAALAVLEPGFPAFAAEQEAARVIAVTPGVFVERDGQRIALAVKDSVFTQDTIVTDATGKAQILFRDDTTIAVAPDSTIHVSQFSFGGKNKAAFGMRVGRGMSRVVTGRVVEQNREGFHITTPHATVGIRGTILTPRVTAEATTVIVSQIGAGHTVSVINTQTGQISEVGRAGLTVVAAPSGNVMRPSTSEEKAEAQTAARQTTVAVAPASNEVSSGGSAASGENSAASAGSGGDGMAASSAVELVQTSRERVEETSAEASGSLPDGNAVASMAGNSVGNTAYQPIHTESLEEIVKKVEAAVTENGSTMDKGEGGKTDGGNVEPKPVEPDPDHGGNVGPEPVEPDPEHGGNVKPEPVEPDPDLGPDVGELPDDPDWNQGGSTTNPSNLTATYAGTLNAGGAGGNQWDGSFHFDVNLGSGDLNNAGVDLTSLPGTGASVLSLEGGTGKAESDRFIVGDFTSTYGTAPGGDILKDIQGSMGGSLVVSDPPAQSTTVDQLHIFGKDNPDLVTWGQGTGQLQSVGNVGGGGQ